MAEEMHNMGGRAARYKDRSPSHMETLNSTQFSALVCSHRTELLWRTAAPVCQFAQHVAANPKEA